MSEGPAARQENPRMTFIASHPGAIHYPADQKAFDTEGAAMTWARGETARGVASVVVYEVADERIEPHQRLAGVKVVPLSTGVARGPQIDEFEESA